VRRAEQKQQSLLRGTRYINRRVIVAIKRVRIGWWERGRSCAPVRAASAVAAYGR
jgi:hypothetical protein